MVEFASLIVGLFMPLVVSYIKSCAWPDALKVLVSLLACAAAGALVTWVDLGRDWSAEAWLKNAGIVFAAATSFYKMYFERTVVNQNLEDRGPFGPASTWST